MSLPRGLQFLQLGWWVLHALTIWFVWSWAYQRGRQAERRHAWQQRRTAAGRAARRGSATADTTATGMPPPTQQEGP